MNQEEALKLIDDTKRDFTQKQRFLRCLQILAKYDGDLEPVFEHDQMHVADFETTVAAMTSEEVVEMASCGWFCDEEAWSCFA